MRPKSMFLLVLALGCGLVAAMGINQYMEGQKNDHGPQQDRTMIVVAKEPIPRGTMLTEDFLTLKKWPSEDIPEGAVNDVTKVAGRVAKQKLFAGEVILEAKLADEGSTRAIPKGYRLVTIKVNYWSVTSGFVRPDDRVDVIMVLQGVAKPVLENVAVYAVDQELTRDSHEQKGGNAGAQGVTLLVTPEQAVMLSLVNNQAQLWLSLRPELDEETGGFAGSMTLDDVLRSRAQTGSSKSGDSDPAATPAQVADSADSDFSDKIGEFLNPEATVAEGEKWMLEIMVGPEVRTVKEFHLDVK